MFWYIAPPTSERVEKQRRRPGWRDEDRETLRRCGVPVHECLSAGKHDATLEPPASGGLVAPGPAWTAPHTLYLVYNAALREGHGVRGGPWQVGDFRVLPGAPVQLSFEHVMCQNHSCITQLILRLGDEQGVKEHFEVASRVFGQCDRGGKTWNFFAPQQCGRYTIDFVTDWQYSMRDAVANKVQGQAVRSGTPGQLATLLVGEEVPWMVERLVWLLCLAESMPPEIGRKVCQFLGHWREPEDAAAEESTCTRAAAAESVKAAASGGGDA